MKMTLAKNAPPAIPPHKIIETHFHLDYLKEFSTEEILSQCHQYKIEKLLTIAVSPSNLNTVNELTKRFPEVYGTQGIHPHEAMNCYAETYEVVKKNIDENSKILAIGEIGLDYYYNKSPKEDQATVFQNFLEMAIKLKKPVVVHTRDADDDTANLLKQLAPSLCPQKGVLHSFTSGIPLLECALDLGFSIGINGICTFPKGDNVRDIILRTPLERILLETDAPFLTPIPFRGKENSPIYLHSIALKVAEVKKISLEEVLLTCYKNSINVFQFPTH